MYKIKGFDQRQHDMEYVKEIFSLVSISGSATYTQIQWARLPGSIVRRELKKQICVFNKRKMCNCNTHHYEHDLPYANEKEIFEAELDYHKLAHKMTIRAVEQLKLQSLVKQDYIE